MILDDDDDDDDHDEKDDKEAEDNDKDDNSDKDDDNNKDDITLVCNSIEIRGFCMDDPYDPLPFLYGLSKNLPNQISRTKYFKWPLSNSVEQYHQMTVFGKVCTVFLPSNLCLYGIKIPVMKYLNTENAVTFFLKYTKKLNQNPN